MVTELVLRDLVLAGLLIVGPLLGATRLSPRLTAVLGWFALGFAALLAAVVDTSGDGQETVGVAVAATGSLLALWISILRAQRAAAAQRLLAQHAVARVGAESRTLDDAAPRMLAAIGDALDWHLGALWELDDDAGALRQVASWHADGVDPRAFDRAGDALRLAPGEGLPGRVWQTGAPAWIVEVSSDPNFPRAAAALDAGLCSAFAFPLRARDEVVGVIEFFARERRPPNGELLRAMATFGTQIGTYVDVKRAEQAVHESEALKTAILDTSLDCIITIDANGRVVDWNPAAEATFGYPRDRAIGRELAELVVPGDLVDDHRAGIARQNAGGPGRIMGERIEMRARRADGREIPVELAVNRIDADPPMYAGHLRDISARLAAEQELRRSRDQLDAILGHLADGVTVQDRDGQVVYANAAAARQLGAESAERLVGARATALAERFSLLDEDGEPLPVERLPGERALAGERPDEVVVRYRSLTTGEERWALVKASPIRDADGAVELAVNVFEDVTERKRAETAQRFLAEASRVLGASLDYETTLKSVAQLAVPEIADWCAVDILGPDGRVARVALAHSDPEQVELAEALRRRYPDDAANTLASEVLASGEPLLVRDVSDDVLRRTAHDEEHLRLLQAFEMCSAIIVPFQGLARPLGTLTLATAESRRRFEERDLALAGELASRAATAIENARVYGERAMIAQTLQRSLLPPTLPMIPGIELAARYRAAGEATEVGGDFYDVFELEPSRWGVVIGDVCGKGAEAAAITALARYTVRALAMHERSPVRVLELLNEALLRQRADRQFCTVAYMQVDAARGGPAAIEVACAGHPPPLIVRGDGRVEPASASGTLLGVVDDPAIAHRRVAIGPGELVFLYTDGVTDARVDGDGFFGDERLLEVVAAAAGDDAARAAERIEAAVTATGEGLRDDLAVLVLRNAAGSANGSLGAAPVLAERGMELDVRLPASADAVALARRAIAPIGGQLDGARVEDLVLLVSELVTNGVRHAGVARDDWIGLTVTRAGAGLRVQVTDPGPGFAPDVNAERPGGDADLRHSEGGWGLYLVERIASRWGVQRGDRTTVWFELDPPRPADDA